MRSDDHIEKLNDEKVKGLLLEAEQRRLAPERRNIFKLAAQKLNLRTRGLDLLRVLRHIRGGDGA
jgi:hypothetical protein